MSKIFISHITEENEVAIALKDLLEPSFLGLVEFFVSSDDSSIPMGRRWLDDVTDALKACAVEIIVCSPWSVLRPWINFEAGAGWIRGIAVIPVCHSGMEPSKLPVPLNLLQGTAATDASGLQRILPVLASSIGSRTPAVDFAGFISRVQEFEDHYTFWDQCNAAFQAIAAASRQAFHTSEDSRHVLTALRQNRSVVLNMRESVLASLEDPLAFLEKHNILRMQRTADELMTESGMYYGSILVPLPRLPETLADERLRI